MPEPMTTGSPTAWARCWERTYFPLPGWQKLDWGLSQINLNHDFTASMIYQLPFGKGKHSAAPGTAPLTPILGNWEAHGDRKGHLRIPGVRGRQQQRSGVNFQNNGNSLNRPNQTCNPRQWQPNA